MKNGNCQFKLSCTLTRKTFANALRYPPTICSISFSRAFLVVFSSFSYKKHGSRSQQQLCECFNLPDSLESPRFPGRTADSGPFRRRFQRGALVGRRQLQIDPRFRLVDLVSASVAGEIRAFFRGSFSRGISRHFVYSISSHLFPFYFPHFGGFYSIVRISLFKC